MEDKEIDIQIESIEVIDVIENKEEYWSYEG